MRIVVIAICKNEARMLPWFIRHYQRWADSFLFFDNGSTDGTLDIIASTSNADVIPFETLGYYKFGIHRRIKNRAYQQIPTGGDWFLMVDMDEFIWHPDLRGYLESCIQKGITLPRLKGYQMYADAFPVDDGVSQLVDVAPLGVRDRGYDKSLIVHKSVDVRYDVFEQSEQPAGNVQRGEGAPVKLLRYNMWNLRLFEKRHEYETDRDRRFSREVAKQFPMLMQRTFMARRKLERACAFKVAQNVVDDAVAEEALRSLFEEASGGDVEAQWGLGWLAYSNHLTGDAESRAKVLFNQAVDSGYVPALYLLGDELATQGRALEAVKVFEAGAEDCSECADRAARIYKNNETLQDFSRSASLFEKAAAREHLNGLYQLGCLYRSGQGVAQDMARGEALIKRSADLGYPLAVVNYGVILCQREAYQEAYPYILKAAYAGSAVAYDNLHFMHTHRLGIPDDAQGSLDYMSNLVLESIAPI